MATVTIKGSDIHYEVIGNGEPLLFLHGMGASGGMFEPQIEAFKEQFQLILVDLRGHGQSTNQFPSGSFSYDDMVADLPMLLDQLQIPSAHVLGVSMGGVVAQMLASRYPSYVKRLILADTWCELPDQTSKIVVALTVFLSKILPVSFINGATYSLYKGKEADQVYTREILKKSLHFTKETFIAMKTTPLPAIKPHLHKITSETLVMYGDRKSYGIDEEKGARTIAGEISKSTLVAFKDAFDPVTLMRKDECNAIVRHFLTGQELPELAGVTYEKLK